MTENSAACRVSHTMYDDISSGISPCPKKLDKPIAIPQAHNDIGMPFARAYSDTLAQHGISEASFLQFIDDLNVSFQEQRYLSKSK